MAQVMEIQQLLADTFSHSEINEKLINAVNRQTYSVQDKIVATIEKGDVKINLQKIRTKKFMDDHSTIFKDTTKITNQLKQQEKLVTKAFSDVNVKLNDISESTKYISNGIDTLAQGMQALEGLACLNVALGAANLCATLVTFQIMNEKLNSIQCGVDDINRKLNQMIKAKEIDISTDIKDLVSDYKHMLDIEEKGSQFSLEDYRKLLKRIYLYDDKLINYYLYRTVNNPDEILSAIYLLSGMLAQLIKRYDELYYFKYKNETNSIDPEHGDWMQIFELLSSKEFLDIVANHCFFDNSLSNRKTQEIISKLYYSQVNNAVLIEDSNLIAHQCEDSRMLSDFMKKMNERAYAELDNQVADAYNMAEEKPIISQEEMDRKTREAAIRLGYIKE
ncbi:MAG: hypothetical protein IJI66_02845 [Erysipelotrichaceae bacterium]|nr:hypothetical protein [Erysipelotrichaceae bacterium]